MRSNPLSTGMASREAVSIASSYFKMALDKATKKR